MSPKAIDLAILIALSEEFEQLLPQIFDHCDIVRDSSYGTYYYQFHFGSPLTKPIEAIASFIGGMGPDKAGRQMERLLHKWSPRMTTLVGVCGGIHRDVSLCDVIVPSRVDAYLATTKAIPRSADGSNFEHRGIEYQCDHELVQEALHLQFAHRMRYQRWQEECSSHAARMLESSIDKLMRKGLVSHRPKIISGHLASGPVVSAATAFRNWLINRNSQYAAIEMEAAGVAAAAAERVSSERFFTVRGVSDLADERKTQFDRTKKGAIRTVAMTNALGLLRTLADLGVFAGETQRSVQRKKVFVRRLDDKQDPDKDEKQDADELEKIFIQWMLLPPKSSELTTHTHILVVEDEEGILEVTGMVVEAMGATPLLARCGDDALRILNDTPNIDIVLSDIVMPGMSGIDLARHIRDKWPALPVILMSGYPGYADEDWRDNHVAFLQKPFTNDKLKSIIVDVHEDEYRELLITALPELGHCFYLVYSCKRDVGLFMRDFNGKGLFQTAFRHKLKECVVSFARGIIRGRNPELAVERLVHETKKLSMLLRAATIGESPSLNEFTLTLMNDTRVQLSKIHLKMDVEPDISQYLEVDVTIFLCIALIELVDNAIEALNKKGNIRVVLRRLKLRRNVLLQVWSATGPLTDELRARIFEEGFSTKGPERGMGLSIIRKLAEHFGGGVELFEKDGIQFSVTVPSS